MSSKSSSFLPKLYVRRSYNPFKSKDNSIQHRPTFISKVYQKILITQPSNQHYIFFGSVTFPLFFLYSSLDNILHVILDNF
jgi:hypothetical protein